MPTTLHNITNLPYKLKPHQTRNQYLRTKMDPFAGVNIMPASVYILMFNDPELKKLAPSDLVIGTYTTNTVKIVGSCLFYLVHPDTTKLQEVTFYVAKIMVVSCCPAVQHLCLDVYILAQDWLDYLPPRASLITSSLDHPWKAKRALVHRSKKEVSTQSKKQVVTVPDAKQVVSKLVTSKEQILQSYPDVSEGITCFPDPPYHIQIDQSITPKQTPCRPIMVHLKEAFKQKINKMMKLGVLKSVDEANPWINRFVLVEGKEKHDNLKLRICLDPSNLNKVIVKEPFHFKTPEDIAH